jgi:DNA transformation protein
VPAPKVASRKLEFVNHVVEQMGEFGPVQAKAMFGGHGIYWQGLMFALILQEQLYFKADAQSVEAFTSRGLGPFTYEAKGKRSSLRYFEAPIEVMDEPQEMAVWCRRAYDCALRQRKSKK